MISITVAELKLRIKNKEDLLLIDVREPWEHEEYNIGGYLIPLSTLMDDIEKIDKKKPVVFYCRKGIRSQIAIQRLQQKYNYNNLINLAGGMDAWQKEGPSL
ncbi:MAG: rhodanese-like domain-containing protein [Ferruginibacter sp.]